MRTFYVLLTLLTVLLVWIIGGCERRPQQERTGGDTIAAQQVPEYERVQNQCMEVHAALSELSRLLAENVTLERQLAKGRHGKEADDEEMRKAVSESLWNARDTIQSAIERVHESSAKLQKELTSHSDIRTE